jgi:sugar/nucleoside kinase (ribokinase family)
MSETYSVVVGGHICLDIIPDLTRGGSGKLETILQPGRLAEIGPMSFSTGGPVSNTGLALQKLGITTRLMGKVGDDMLGQTVKHVVNAYGSHLAGGMVTDPAVHTSYTIIVTLPGTDRILLHHPGANDTFKANDIRYELLAEARLFHFGYPPLMKLMYQDEGAELADIFRRAKATGVTTSLDMALPDPNSAAGQANWPAILRATLPYVDIFMPSLEEIVYMLHPQTYHDLCRRADSLNFLPFITPEFLSDLSQELLVLGVKIIGLKLGERGLYLRTASQLNLAGLGRGQPSNLAGWAGKELWAPCFKVEVVGTAGSGDATIAGFLAAMLNELSPEAAALAAVAVGACNVEAADTLSGILSWDETMQRVAQGWPLQALTLTAPGWRVEDRASLWVKEK